MNCLHVSGNGYNKLSEEIVMEHDVTLDEYTLLPFLKSLLSKIGFRRQRTFADFIRNSVLERRQANQTRSYLNVRYVVVVVFQDLPLYSH